MSTRATANGPFFSVLSALVTWAEDSEGEPEFTHPLPPEDRLWRHPSEWSAEQREAYTEPARADAPAKTPRARPLLVAGLSALGGALLVAGVFITLDSADPPIAQGSPTSGAVVADTDPEPPAPPLYFGADDWASVVSSQTAPAVARVRVTKQGDQYQGSAVVFRGDGWLLTAAALVEGADEVALALRDGSEYTAAVVGVDNVSGLAVLHVAGADLAAAPLNILQPQPYVGDSVVAVGGTGSTDQLKTVNVSETNVFAATSDNNTNLHGLIMLDGGSLPSNTGGAVVDRTGTVVGIVVDLGARNTTFVVPVGYARAVAEDIVLYGNARHAWLAVRGVDAQALAATDPQGAVRLTEIIDDGPAAFAGLNEDDLVIALDDYPVASMSELVVALRAFDPGEQVDVTYVRNEITHTAPLVLGNRPNN